MTPLSPRQREVFEWASSLSKWPTQGMIAVEFGVRPATARAYVVVLEKKGYVRRRSSRWGDVEIIHGTKH